MSPRTSAYDPKRTFRLFFNPNESRISCGRLILMGLLLALHYYVPLLNLVVPVLSGLAFTHLCLGALARLRHKG